MSSALVVAVLELGGDGLTPQGRTLGLFIIVGLHIGLLALFVLDDFGTQKRQLQVT